MTGVGAMAGWRPSSGVAGIHPKQQLGEHLRVAEQVEVVDRSTAVIPHVPVRQWVSSLPIPLRLLLAAQPELVTPMLSSGLTCSLVARQRFGAVRLWEGRVTAIA